MSGNESTYNIASRRNPEAMAKGSMAHITFGSTFRKYLRKPVEDWPTADELISRPFLERIVVKSLFTCLEDTEVGARERKTVMERVEGRPVERKEVGITMGDLAKSALATSIRDIQQTPEAIAGRAKTVIVEPGPNKEAPMEGAVLEHIEPTDPRWTEVEDGQVVGDGK